MANVKGRGVRIEVASTFGTPKTVSAISNASPGIASSTSHGLADGTCGYFDVVTGMDQLTYQAARVDAPAADSFTLQGLNTTNMGTFATGTFVPATAWLTLAEATQYNIGGGAGSKLNVTRLIDVLTQEEQGNLAAQTLALNLIAQTVPTAAGEFLAGIAQATGRALVRITFPDGAIRLAYGEPSLPGESVGQGAVGTGSIDFTVKGYALSLPA